MLPWLKSLAWMALALSACTAASQGGAGSPPRVVSSPKAVLTCADMAASAAADTGSLVANGVAFADLGASRGDLLTDALRLSSGGVTYDLVKAFLYVLPDASPRTGVTVVSPPDARLYYTDIRTWSSRPSDAEIIAGSARAFTVESCPGRSGGYPGGLLVPGRSCVTLVVYRVASASRQAIKVPIGVARC